MKAACPVRKEAGGKVLREREVTRRRPTLPLGRRIWPAKLRFGLLPVAPWALGHTQPQVSPHKPAISGPGRRHKKAQEACRAILLILQLLQDLAIQLRADCLGPGCRPADLKAGAQGRPGKALSPNCRGGSFPGRRQTAATPRATIRESSRHSYRAENTHPGWRRPCAQFQSRFCAGFRNDAWVCPGRCLLYAHRTERTAAPAERQRHCRPGRFLLHGAHSAG